MKLFKIPSLIAFHLEGIAIYKTLNFDRVTLKSIFDFIK